MRGKKQAQRLEKRCCVVSAKYTAGGKLHKYNAQLVAQAYNFAGEAFHLLPIKTAGTGVRDRPRKLDREAEFVTDARRPAFICYSAMRSIKG